MEVDEDDRRVALHRFDLTQHDRERIVERGHEDAAHDVDDSNGDAVARADDHRAFARRAGGEVGGPDQPRLGREVRIDLLLVPHVIAGGHRGNAVAGEIFGEIRRDAEARGGILDVGDDEVGLMMRDETGQPAANQLAAGTPADVANEQQLHGTRVTFTGMSVPRRSSIRGTMMRSRPPESSARALAALTGVSSRSARAKRPKLRSARWKRASFAAHGPANFSPTTTTALSRMTTRRSSGPTPGTSSATSIASPVS